METSIYRGLGLVILLSLGACSKPLLWLPGSALSGPEAQLSAAVLPAEGGVLIMETRPADPYSVNIGYTVIDGYIHIDPAEERRWYQHIKMNSNVRIQLEGEEPVYPAKALVVEDPQVLAQFEPDRIVLRIEPR
ncbi:MAG: hypothetical protein NXH95_14705 [Pseudomonadaceae bacterium]|nr:hypothetical protein [Pseudomonadaceae bacterium]